MTNLEAYMAGLIPDDHPMIKTALTDKLIQPRMPMAPAHETPRKKVWGATDVRGTASPQDVQTAQGIQSWVADRPATLEAVPENFARGVVGMAAGFPQMVADPIGMAEAVVDQGTRLFGGIDPEEFNKLQREIGPRRLDMYIKRNMAPDILSPKEEARVQTLLDKRSTVRAEELLKNPAESAALLYGGAKGLMGRPGTVSRENPLSKPINGPEFFSKATPEKEALLGSKYKVAPSEQKYVDAGLLRPAIKKGSKVYTAPTNRTHFTVAEKAYSKASREMPYEEFVDYVEDKLFEDGGPQRGYVTPDGEFLDPWDALDWVEKNQPDIYKSLDFGGGGLESINYGNSVGLEVYSKAAPEKEAFAGALGRQQTISRSATILDDPKYTERQPVSEWIKTLQTTKFPKDEPALALTLNKLKSMPIKDRLTKGEVQQMLNREAPELETVVVKNPTQPEREGELFVRDPNEYENHPGWDYNIPDNLWEKQKEVGLHRDSIFKKIWEDTGGVNIENHPKFKELQKIDSELEGIRKLTDTLPRHRYDGHSWAKQEQLSEPLGRTGFMTRENADGSKTLVIDNFQMPTEGSGSRTAIPEAHQKRAYDLMTQSILNYAREKGYKDVEWTTGMEQNRRWGVYADIDPGMMEELITKAQASTDPTVAKQAKTFNDEFLETGEMFEELLRNKPELQRWIESNNKGTMAGDLRPLYDKTLPKLMEKYGLGEKVGESGAKLEKMPPDMSGWERYDKKEYIDERLDKIPEQKLRDIFDDPDEPMETYGDLLEWSHELLGSMDSYSLEDLIQNTPELWDDVSPTPRKSIRVQGQKPQPLIYSKVPTLIGGQDATQDR